jgi:ribosomal protein S18 acetylase RimI-like enzyme
MINLDNSKIVVCRPALAKDTDEVMELSSHIWEGGDYIPHVWDEWLADPEGLLGVAELEGRVVGVFKLTKFQDQEWYMEGLRVHPDFRDQGIASHIHHYVLDSWRRMGGGIIRLTTASHNVKVHRMCEQTGFKRIAEFIPYRAQVLDGSGANFIQVEDNEDKRAMDFVLASQTHALSSGLINLGWVYTDPQIRHLQDTIKDEHAWWWRGNSGFIAIWEDEDDGERVPGIQLLACPIDKLGELLLDYRRLMDKLGYQSAGWTAPNHPEVISGLQQAGFERSWDISLYVYELKL